IEKPFQKTTRPSLENTQGKDQFLGLMLESVVPLDLLRRRPLVKDRFIEILTRQEFSEIKIVFMFANTVESLVKRSQALLTIKNEKCMFMAVKRRRTFKLTTSEKAV